MVYDFVWNVQYTSNRSCGGTVLINVFCFISWGCEDFCWAGVEWWQQRQKRHGQWGVTPMPLDLPIRQRDPHLSPGENWYPDSINVRRGTPTATAQPQQQQQPGKSKIVKNRTKLLVDVLPTNNRFAL